MAYSAKLETSTSQEKRAVKVQTVAGVGGVAGVAGKNLVRGVLYFLLRFFRPRRELLF